MQPKRPGPYSYEWAPGDWGYVVDHEAHGLFAFDVDIIEVDGDRVLVDDGSVRVWVPRSVIGEGEDFGLIDDAAYFKAQDEAERKK